MNRFNRIIQYYHMLAGGDLSYYQRIIISVLYRFFRWYYHCDIPSTAVIKDVYFCHNGFGIVINPKARIGKGTVIQHRVTIGEIGDGVPCIGENCYIGAGAIVIGKITIGNNVKIGAGAVVITDIPSNSTAVGVPARVVSNERPLNEFNTRNEIQSGSKE